MQDVFLTIPRSDLGFLQQLAMRMGWKIDVLLAKDRKTMNTTAILSHSKAVDSDTYWNMLKNLSSEIKLELISKLSASLLKKEALENAHWVSDFAGKWKDDRSAEEIVADKREARKL